MNSNQKSVSPVLQHPSPISDLQSHNSFWELAVILIAALVRFWRLNYHSIWFDEAVSLSWAQRPIGEIWSPLLTFVPDKHPPLYYVLLHGWMKLMGLLGLAENDIALRSLGALIGVLTVWGVLRLCLWTTKRNVALLTSTLVALSPLMVWYSQEVRMFQLASAAGIWAAYFLLRAWYGSTTGERLVHWLGMIIAFECALYSYLFSAFLLPAAGIMLLALVMVQRRWREFTEGVVALGIVGGLFLPLAINAWQVGGAEAVPGSPFQDLLANHWRLLRTFTIWRVDWLPNLTLSVLILFGVLFLLGIVAIFAKANEAHIEQPEHQPQRTFWTRFFQNQPTSAADAPPLPFAATSEDEADADSPALPYRWDYDDDDPLRFLPLIWLSVPLLIANLLLAKDQTIFAEDRYLLFLSPFALWLIAEGVVWLWALWKGKRLKHLSDEHPFAGIGGLLVAGILAAALPTLWTPAVARENWRAAADYILSTVQAEPALKAAVVAHVDYTQLPLAWYLRKEKSQEELPLFFPFGGRLTPEEVDSTIAPPLQGIVDLGVDTLWLTQSHLDGVDDGHLVEGWLNQNFALVTEQFPAGIKLSGYALRSIYPQLPPLRNNALRQVQEIVPGLTLIACEIVNPTVGASDDMLHPPSGWVHVRLWWQASGTIADNYIASVQMIGSEGVWGDRLYRGNEALRRFPTSSWTSGTIVRDEIDVNLNPLTPTNEYPIVVGVRDSADQPAGATAECGRVRIVN